MDGHATVEIGKGTESGKQKPAPTYPPDLAGFESCHPTIFKGERAVHDRFNMVFVDYFGWQIFDDMEPMNTNLKNDQEALLACAILSSHCLLDSQQPKMPKPPVEPQPRRICESCGELKAPDFKHTDWLCRLFGWIASYGT